MTSFEVDYSSYCNVIESLLDKNDKDFNFKSNRIYQSILEHVSIELGGEYLRLIKGEFNLSDEEIIRFCQINDKIGKPVTYLYKGDIRCSPTTLRYIYHANIILKYIREKCQNIDNLNIIEIGGGYGGLCLAINFFMKSYNIKINKYTIIDLESPRKLQKKYLSSHELNFQNDYLDADNYGMEIIADNNFLISNYAFSEIKREFRQNYIKILFGKINHGFMVWNDRIYPKIDRDVTTSLEKPMTNSQYNNFFVMF